MAAASINGVFDKVQVKALAGPILIVMILAMMVLPLPPFLLDLLFTFNIALGLIVLLTSMYTTRPLDFAAFPTVLLLTTLLRLSLNVASTRVVLLHGHTGPDAAGKVIEAFGHFLVGGNFTVGLVVFIILVVINFVVITKGAGRIAEVSARFTLDAMPGKQMAIDADLNAGLIGEAEARKRRQEVGQEAEFYGSMDGASKFVRGDAIAGILILFINIIGGLAIGMLQHDLSFAQASNNYVLLAIGDGLVAQIPALVISTAAGLVVSRVGTGSDIGAQIMDQLFMRRQVLNLCAGVLGIMGLIPGMPHFAFLLLAAALAGLAYYLKLREAHPEEEAAKTPVAQPVNPEAAQEASWEDITPVDTLGLEVGYRLIPLVDKAQDGELLRRIKAIRKKFAQEIGFLPPAVHIRDNLELKPAGYRISLKGVVVGEGEAFPGQLLAINPGRATTTLPGAQTKDPAFGLPATWIDPSQRERAVGAGFTVVDAGTVVATHLSHVVTTNASALLGRAELQSLVDHFSKSTPKLIEDLVPKLIPFSSMQKVLQNLLAEGVHIRDLRSIVETLTDHAARTQDTSDLTAVVRVALGASIVQQIYGSTPELAVIVVEPELEKVLGQALASDGFGLEPGLAETLLRDSAAAVRHQETLGMPTALLVPDRLRNPLARLLRRALPQLRVLAHAEIPDSRSVRVSSVLGARA
ncbi:MAG TPA: flagellar biosynthesis protein FlhA [Burkholderiales bacterium]|nr:flagellar biosynthesis protein FlhA [Burkholderiales bacterium]